VYEVGKEFAYDHVMRHKIVPFKKGTDLRLNVKVDTQKRSLKGILLLFMEPYAAGTHDLKKYIFPGHHQSQSHNQRLAKYAV